MQRIPQMAYLVCRVAIFSCANFVMTKFYEVRCLQATPKQHQNNPFWCCPSTWCLLC